MRKDLCLLLLASGALAAPMISAQTGAQTAPAPAQKAPAARRARAAAPAGTAAWTPEVQQYLGVQQGSFTMVGLNKLSKAQLDALVQAAKNNLAGDPGKHVLNCGVVPQSGKARVFLTVAGDDPSGQRATEIRQTISGLDSAALADSAQAADRVLHVVIQEQTLGKRTIGFTASYVTGTPCTDQGRKTDAELKGQLGTYTDPRGVDLAQDLAKMLDEDLRSARDGRANAP